MTETRSSASKRRAALAWWCLAAGICLLVLAAGRAQAAPAHAGPVLSQAGQATPVPGVGKLPTGLQAELAQSPDSARITVIVLLRDQANLSDLASVPREARRALAAETRLRAQAAAASPEVEGVVARRRLSGELNVLARYWIFNGLAVSASPAAIQELAALPQVAAVYSNTVFTLAPPVVPPQPAPLVVAAAGSPEPNLTQIGAPAMWAAGHRGQNVVIASLDTGVDVTHPDLAAQWRGGTNSWYDPWGQHPITPTDNTLGVLAGHGTAVMGIMVGGSAGGTAIGVAPGAKWIAAKIFNDSYVRTDALTISATQWLLDPDGNPSTDDAPQIVNNSWGGLGCWQGIEPALYVLRQAGILPVFAAGNDGPGVNTDEWPANNPSALAVGSVNSSDVVSDFSSRGPTGCGGGGAAPTFPALVAPGESVRTTTLNGGYVLDSGTSLSAPHVSGALALLLSAYPFWQVADLQSALLNSAAQHPGPVWPNNDYGYGRLDVLAADTWLMGHVTHYMGYLPFIWR